MQNKIFIAGHTGMVGSALLRKLSNSKTNTILTATRKELNLCNQKDVHEYLEHHKPNIIYLAAAKVGGINANNSYPAEFIYENLQIQNNVIWGAFKADIKKLLFLGSSCIYPKYAEQPIEEKELLNGFLEPTNEPYAIAKIAGLKLCESINRQYSNNLMVDYRAVMPTNLYGPEDNFYSAKDSHVIPALLSRFHLAKMNKNQAVEVWGSGNAKREFLHVDDLADACIKIMGLPREALPQNSFNVPCHINIGSGEELSIKALSNLIKETVGFEGKIQFNTSMPDGTPRKSLDTSVLDKLKWRPRIKLSDGLKTTYEYMLSQKI